VPVPISLVAAVATNRVIGRDGSLPWRLPADLAHFRALTMGHAVLMGRKTYQSIGKPLRGRRNIVLTRSRDLRAPGCVIVHSLEEAREAAGSGADAPNAATEELLVIGGAAVYARCLPFAHRLYITHIGVEFPGDAFFPVIDAEEWTVVSARPGALDTKNALPHRFVTYERGEISLPPSP
jgi:dihydrofolate reductase